MLPPDPAQVHLCECDACQAGDDRVIQQHHERINLLLSRLEVLFIKPARLQAGVP